MGGVTVAQVKQKAPSSGASLLCGCGGGEMTPRYPLYTQFVTPPHADRGTGKGRNSAGNTRRVMFFHHGAGGGGEITQGIMRAQRQQSWVGDADIFVGGHWHVDWQTRMERLRLSSTGVVYRDTVLHMALPSLKNEYDMSGGFHVERGRAPRPQGAYWLTFRHNSAEHGRVDFDVARG